MNKQIVMYLYIYIWILVSHLTIICLASILVRSNMVAQMVNNLPQCRRPWFDPWVGKMCRRKEWLPTPVFLPGESHGQRSLAAYSPWGHKESDRTERLTHSHTKEVYWQKQKLIWISKALYSVKQSLKSLYFRIRFYDIFIFIFFSFLWHF